MADDINTPKFKVPFNIVGTAAEYVEQGSLDELAQCVENIVTTEPGQREDVPEYGMDDPTFLEGGIDPNEIEALASEWEPRVETLTSSEIVDLTNEVLINVRTGDNANG